MVLTIGTDCSGIEAPIEALRQMKIPFVQKWRCEIDKFANISAEANYPKPEMFYEDMLKRDHKKLSIVDLYVCGFPCQSFSMAGYRKGLDDPRSGIILQMVKTIFCSKPNVFILENVKGFVSIHNGEAYQLLLKTLNKDGKYSVYSDIYKTRDYGLPQNRERLYIIGIKKSIQKKDYVKPKCLLMKSLADIIDSSKMGEGNKKYDHLCHKIKKNINLLLIAN